MCFDHLLPTPSSRLSWLATKIQNPDTGCCTFCGGALTLGVPEAALPAALVADHNAAGCSAIDLVVATLAGAWTRRDYARAHAIDPSC